VAYLGSQPNSEFGAGVSHLANAGRGNDNSVTLNGSLQADSDRWDAESQEAAVTPHSVLSTYNFSRSANGSDGQNYLPNGDYLGSGDGASADTFDKSLMLRMAAGNSGVA
jgi:hypothetical protein